ncbi:ABC transporter ATP-binding protein [Microbacterium sp. HD4P20]|uniref:ABC transporter ATP-binding protein n=1 Tax=Microbacterium sp. HD4P20 TaxID=2864874 RepID=UPI001C63E189|nr:ABC transporter ATP-binding protein [Microbacterium sp. HD4P20]MCP2638417.1 ABC transporter ATP-binding protein [Microbacterium sp. HD4P20]
MIPIRLDGVSKTYGEDSEAEPTVTVDLTVQAGEFFTLLGPSGCGKSTLLRMIAGFVQPSAGRIRFGEKDVTGLPPHKRGTGMVFQNYALFPHMPVADNVAYGLKLRRVSKAERVRRVDRALERVGLEGYGRRRIDQLSGGQQQRVALARAIVIEPDVLLLDEPLSNLDAKLREETRMQIREVQKSAATTAVYVTHDQAEAMAMSDRIAVLADGRAHQIDTPRKVYSEPATAFVARFIGRSNVVAVQIESVEPDVAHVRFGDGRLIVHRSNQEAPVVGETRQASIRPETIRIVGEADADFHGVIESVEFLGSTAMLDVDIAGSRVTVSTPEIDVEAGSRVGLTVAARSGWLIPS